MCAANVGPDGGIKNVKSFSYDAAKSGETIKASVVCDEGLVSTLSPLIHIKPNAVYNTGKIIITNNYNFQ